MLMSVKTSRSGFQRKQEPVFFRSVGSFFRDVPNYSRIENNFAYASEEEAGMKPGEYIVRDGSSARRDMPAFENLPVEKMGRY